MDYSHSNEGACRDGVYYIFLYISYVILKYITYTNVYQYSLLFNDCFNGSMKLILQSNVFISNFIIASKSMKLINV